MKAENDWRGVGRPQAAMHLQLLRFEFLGGFSLQYDMPKLPMSCDEERRPVAAFVRESIVFCSTYTMSL